MGVEYKIISTDGGNHSSHYDNVKLKEYPDHYKLYLGSTYQRIIKDGILEHWHTHNMDQFFCKQYDGTKLIRVIWD